MIYIGNTIRTVVPASPGSRLSSRVRLCTSILPPCSSTILWLIDRPSPLPSGLVVKKGSKIRRRCSTAIPLPVSRISIVSHPPTCRTRRRSNPPSGIA